MKLSVFFSHLRKIPVRISPFSLFFFLFLLWMEPSGYTFLPLLAALCHEAGHVLALCLTGRKILYLRIYPFGFDLRTEGIGSYTGDLLVHGAGIATNLLLCLLFAPHLEYTGAAVFFTSNLLLALLNLCPVETLDGGAVLAALLGHFLSPQRAYPLCRKVSFVSLFLLWLFATYLLFFTCTDISLFSMTLYLFACLFLGEKKSK